MAPQDHDLKSQLSDIQKRLSETTFNTPKRANTQRRGNENPAPATGQQATSPTDPRGPTEKRSFSNLISRREKRVSLPSLEGTKSVSTPSKGAAKDMDFVVGLSENLLQECRKLQAENQIKSHKLATIEAEFNKMKANNANLMAKLNDTMQAEEKYKDSNWELEMKLQHLTQELTVLSENYQKSQKELAKQTELSHEMRTELEELSMNRASLEREFSSNKVSATGEIQDLKSHVDELNDENTRLNDEIDELRRKLEAKEDKPKAIVPLKVPDLRPNDDSDSDAELNEPPVSPVKTVSMGNDALQTETLKASLQNAHQTIAKLRAQILKLRQGELSSKQSQHMMATPKKSQSPLVKKKGLPDSIAKNIHIMGNNNRGSTVIYDESLASMDDDEWEQFEGDSTSLMSNSPSKKPRRPLSIISAASKELIPDSDSDFEDTVDFAAPLSSELQTISADDASRYAEENNLVMLPVDEFEKLKDLSGDDLENHASAKGFHLLPIEEKDRLYSTLSSKEDAVTSLSKDLTAHKQSADQYQKEAADFREKLESALADVKTKESEISKLKQEIANPTHEYIKSAASSNSLLLVPVAEHESIQSQLKSLQQHVDDPSHAFILEKASAKNLKVLSQDEHNSLQEQLNSLKSQLTEHQSTGSQLQKELSAVKDTHEKAIAEHTTSLSSIKSETSKKIEELQHLIDNPSVEYIKEKAAVLGYTAIEESVYQKTLDDLTASTRALEKELEQTKSDYSKQWESPPLDYIVAKATAHGFKTVNADEHDRELSSLNGTVSSLQSELVAVKEATAAAESTVSELEKKLSSVKLQRDELTATLTASQEELTTTKATIQSLESEIASLKAAAVEAKTASDETVADLEKQLSSVTTERDELKVALAAASAEVVSLKSTLESVEAELAAAKDNVVETKAVSDKVIAALKVRLSTVQGEREDLNNSLIAAQQELDQHKQQVSSLNKQISAPTKDYLMEHGTNQGLSVIPKVAHVALLEKANKTVHDLASESNLVVLDNDKHSELEEKATNPPLEHLVSVAEKQGYKIISVDDHDTLQKNASRTIEDFATEHEVTLVPNEEYTEIQRKINEPTLEEVKSAAASLGLVAVPEKEYEVLVEEVKSPSESHITEKAAILGLSAVPVAELASLRSTKSELAEKVESVASLENDVALLKEDIVKKDAYIEELTAVLNEKEKDLQREPILPKESLLKQASAIGLVALTTSEHKSLTSPSKEQLSKHAESHKHVLIPTETYSELRQKAAKTLDDLANEARMVVLSYDDHEKLLAPSPLQIEAQAKSHGLSLLPDSELATLKTRSAKTVHDLAEESGMIAVPSDEYEKLLHPSQEKIGELAKEFGFVMIPKADFETLELKSSRTASDLAKEEGLVLLQPSEHEALLDPSENALSEICSKRHLTVIDEDKYKELESSVHSPSLAFLTSKAEVLGMALVEKKRYDQLVEYANKSIEDLAQENNFALMTVEKHNELTQPTLEKIKVHAKGMGHVVLAKDEHSKLRDVASLDVSEISSRLTDLGHVAVSAELYERLTADPSKDEIIALCQKHDIQPLDKSAYEKFMSADYLSSRAAELGMVVVGREEFDILKATAEEPDKQTVENHAAKLGCVVIGKREYEALQKVSKKDLEAKAQKIDHVLIPKAELDELKARMEYESLKTPSTPTSKFAATKDYFETVSRSGEKESRKAKVFESARTLGFVPVAAEEYKHLIEHQKDHVITKSDIYQRAKEFNLAVLPQDEYKTLLKSRQRDSMTMEDLRLYAQTLGLRLVDQSERSTPVRARQRNSITLEDIRQYAENFGMRLVDASELARETQRAPLTFSEQPSTTTLSSVVNESDFTDALSRQPSNTSTINGEEESHGMSVDELRLQATILGYRLVRVDEDVSADFDTPELFHDAASLADDEEDETDTEQNDTVVLRDAPNLVPAPAVLSKDLISSQASEMGLVVLEQSEYESMNSLDAHLSQLSDAELGAKTKELSSKLGMVLLSQDEVKSIETNAVASVRPEDLITAANIATLGEGLNMKVIPDADYANLVFKSNPENVITRENINTLGEQLGLKVLSNEEYSGLVESAKPVTLSKDEIAQKAGEIGLVTLEPQEYDDLTEKAKEAESMSSPEKLALAAGVLGMSVVSARELSELKKPKTLSAGELSEEANDLGLVMVKTEEYAQLNQNTALLEDTTYLTKTLEEKGMVVVDTQTYQGLTEKAALAGDAEYMKSTLESQGYKSVQEAEYASLLAAPKELTSSEFAAKAESLGFVTVPIEAHKELLEKSKEMSVDKLSATAESLGFVLLSNDELESLKKQELPKKELISRVESMGLVAIDKSELDDLKQKSKSIVPLALPVAAPSTGSNTITKEDIMEKSAEFGLVTITEGEYKSLKVTSRADSLLSKSDIVQKAMEYDLVTVSKQELEELRAKAASNRETLKTAKSTLSMATDTPNFAPQDVESWARSHEMMLIPEEAFVATNVSRTPDPQNVVVLPVTYYNKLTKSEALSLDKVANDELLAQIRKRGYHVTGSDFAADFTAPTLTRNNTVTSLSTSNSRKNIAEAAAAAAVAEFDQQSYRAVSRASSRNPSRASSAAPAIPRDVSIHGGLSLMTNASLSEPNIIPALTQTVIGEYLFKYYRRLGPLSSISESRHERYFWVHPYTLTLYWSTTNPVLGDPSAHKTRAAAIVGVESVDDNNPLPAGLYHKSIVIHAQGRSIKFTCPTRQRHNIWYNSLRYLIQRSMDGINLEEDLGLPVQDPRGRA